MVIPEHTTDLRSAVNHPDTDVVVIGLPNHLHEEAVALAAAAGKAVLCTKPLGRTAEEARRMLETVEKAGVFAGYLEDLCYTPEDAQGDRSRSRAGAIGDVTWVRSRETHPGPHSAWFWDGRLTGGGAIIDLGCHCIEIIRNFVGKGNRPVEVMCYDRHPGPPDRRRGQRDRPDPVRVGRDRPVRGQLDVPRRDGPPRRGRRDPRNDLAEPLPPDRLRDVHRGRRRAAMSPRRPRPPPAGSSRSATRSPSWATSDMFSDMFDAMEAGRAPRETFYDGYVVNADHGRRLPLGEEPTRGSRSSCSTGAAARRRGSPRRPSLRGPHGVIKRELLPDGRHKLILKDPATGDFSDRVVAGG